MDLKKIIMYFTLQERERRAYGRYEIERRRMESLTDRELHDLYIRLKSTYEYKKTFFTFVGVTFFVSIVSGIWKSFYQFLQNTFTLYAKQTNSLEITKLIWELSFFLVGIFLVVIFVSFIIYLKNLYSIYKQLLLVEELRNSFSCLFLCSELSNQQED
ncbi:hypothetical protein GP420_002504 [Enterococcus faecalis]|nr:hypothetical protein [Enterococcus faecalis]